MRTVTAAFPETDNPEGKINRYLRQTGNPEGKIDRYTPDRQTERQINR